ncbi:uncharacterized protein Dwil_GK27502, partial [Drosophila willistoni]
MLTLKRPVWLFACFIVYISVIGWHGSQSTPTPPFMDQITPTTASSPVLKMPKITSEFRAGRIYESFRALPSVKPTPQMLTM